MNPRNRKISVRVSDDELARINSKAAENCVAASDLIRSATLGPDAAEQMPSRDLLSAAIRQATGAAGNLNQISKRLNESAKAGELEEQAVRELLAQVQPVSGDVVEALDRIYGELNRLRPRR